ncbi:hypothetical protein PYCCODRAFT_791399 [Trametes coccinea BRFM310]|uniref:Uncharacterized protein n=1 Tax=Trametes coccinea (strain BRFM310) TaxID=1353009 RepID=A0A1Y2J0W5_TRAC3|nr:hypothetical protein PYCCODRAFT_791399 [Trametes coccinea BRFM310]
MVSSPEQFSRRLFSCLCARARPPQMRIHAAPTAAISQEHIRHAPAGWRMFANHRHRGPGALPAPASRPQRPGLVQDRRVERGTYLAGLLRRRSHSRRESGETRRNAAMLNDHLRKPDGHSHLAARADQRTHPCVPLGPRVAAAVRSTRSGGGGTLPSYSFCR